MVIIIENTKTKAGYKETEVGVIPADWGVQSVEDIADVTTGDKDTQDKIDSGAYPFFVRSQNVERINSYSHDGEAVLTAGDGVGVGKVFHYANGKFDFHQRVYMIYNFRKCDGFFFYLYFSNNFYKEATKYNAKNSVDSIRREMVTRMKIPLPSLPEQQAIAAALRDVDALIASLDRLIAKKRDIKQATMQQLLTGKTRLEGFSKRAKKSYKQTEVGVIPEEWEASSWGKLATLEYGKSLRGYENTHGPYPVYGTNGPVGTHTKMLCKHPGVIVGRKGAYRGIHFSKEPFYVIDTAYYLEAKEDIDLKWAYYELLTHDINRMDSGSAIPSTSRETFYNLSVIVPPLPEQQAIAAILTNMDAEITALEQKRDKTRALKQGMMQELLTGKKRLI